MASTWYRKLQTLGACSEAVAWAKTQPSFAVAWKTCKRGDWMLWLLAKRGYKREQIVTMACDCAALALPYTKDPRVSACLDVVRAWTRGEATIEKVNEARRNATDAAAHAYAAADAAADSAAYAAYAAADAAANAAAYAARSKTLAQFADIVRREFPSIRLTVKR